MPLAVLICLAFGLAGCGSGIEVNLNADAALNPANSRDSESLPVVVRLYQLTDDKAFAAASFKEMWKDDAKALGAGLLNREEFVMSPGSTKVQEYERQEGVKYMGVMAIFRNQEGDNWRAVTEINSGFIGSMFSKTVEVSLAKNTINIVE
ncbi:MAG: type VI secretion system lipoprotein TssJ [Thermodesulfobacteriota bacterium]